MCGLQARKGNMNKTYITKQRTNTSYIEMAMSMDWYGCSFYTRLGKTAVNSEKELINYVGYVLCAGKLVKQAKRK